MPTMETAVCNKLTLSKSNEETAKVSFSHVELRDYEIKLGNSPSCTSGPPVELGWCYNKVCPVKIDTYEDIRRGQRRDRAEMIMPSHYRKEKLMEFGYSSRDISEMMAKLTLEKKKLNKSTSGIKSLSKLMRRTIRR
jgi:hypothetical protein